MRLSKWECILGIVAVICVTIATYVDKINSPHALGNARAIRDSYNSQQG
jgi:hypothetical protein